MIISKPKPLSDILPRIKNQPVFIIGCSECATLCKTGGEPEVLAMKQSLEDEGIKVTGWIVLDPACHFLNNKRLLKPHETVLEQATVLLVLACGNGVQTLAELFPSKQIIPGTDTMFLGEIKRVTTFEKRCSMCGECLLEQFDGLCPITRCPKSMLNGPCGGSTQGKCEINPELDCVWDLIVKKLQQKNQLHRLQNIQPPKNWQASTETRRQVS